MADKPFIEVEEDGPLAVHGLERLERGSGEPTPVEPEAWLCRCGGSANKPFCDSTHRRIGFDGSNESSASRDRSVAYRGAAVTVRDNRAVCSHSGVCLARLPSVFRRDQTRWISPDAADAEVLRAAVRACPSGALTLDEGPAEEPGPPRIRVAPNGPYEVRGVELRGEVRWGAGAPRTRYALCRCGASRNKPFCDGRHREVGFRDPPKTSG